MKTLEKTSVPDRSTFEIKHYIIRDEVQKGESGSPIHISTDEKISRHFGKASIQDERVCILKMELMETTSLLKKEDMTPGWEGALICIDSWKVIFQFEKWFRMSSFLSSSESGSDF
jgi:hypothetical protein